MRRIILITFLLLPALLAVAQHPVQVTPQLLPPYTLQVSEYYSPGSAGNKLNLLLLLRDFNKPTLQVRLRMSIEGQGVALRTREDAVFTPLTLQAGEPRYVDPSELAQYFNSNNLLYSGITQQQYEQSGKLPEGFYTFCFEVTEVSTGLVVSNKGCTFAWMTLNEPPFLNIPRKAEEIIPVAPSNQNVLFQWTPRHNASPTAAFTTEYVFSIVEVWPTDISPEAAFISRAPLYTDETNLTTYLYDGTKPPLIEDSTYAWRVQAKAKNGSEDLAMFRNNGYSETFWFVYKSTCAVPSTITATPQGQRVNISWLNNPAHLEFKVEYRERDNPDAVWFEIGNTVPRVSIGDITPGEEYEYRVGAACHYGRFVFSDIKYFNANAANVTTVPDCGEDPNLVVTTEPLMQTLNPGDTIKAGDFNVIATQVTSNQTSFSGEGYVQVSYLANIKLGVRFTNITVATDKKLKSGEIETTYDPTEGGIASLDEYFEGGVTYGSIKNGLDTADHKVNFIIESVDDIDVVTGPGYDPQTGQGPVEIAITGSNNENQVINVTELPATIKDAYGNTYQVNKDGTVSAIGKTGGEDLVNHANTRAVDVGKGTVTFKNYPEKQVYGFDEYKPVYSKSSSFRNKYQKLTGDYYVPAKAIAPGKTDYLKAKVTLLDPTLIPDSVKFVSSKGIIYKTTKLSADEFEIAVIGAPAGDATEIFALYHQEGDKTLNLGKILVASYPEKTIDVKIVPVNGATADIEAIKTSVKQAFGPVNVSFNFSMDNNFQNTDWDVNADGKMDVDETGVFTNYTLEMLKLQSFYRTARPLTANTYYIFLVNEANLSNVQGDMPRGGKYGYVFTNAATNIGRIVAHELGHGALVLKHVYDGEGFEQGDLPDNLMDIGTGLHLTKQQWDYLHDPPFVITMLDSEEDGFSDGNAYTVDAEINGNRTYVTPAGTPVRLPAGSIVKFNKRSDFDLIPNGALYWFKLSNGDEYAAKLDYYNIKVQGGAIAMGASNSFYGYYKLVGGKFQMDQRFTGFETPTITDNKTAIVSLWVKKEPNGVCSLRRFIADFEILENAPPSGNSGSQVNLDYTIEDLSVPENNTIPPLSIPCFVPYEPNTQNNYLEEYFDKNADKLKQWLDKKVKSDVKIYLYDCTTGNVKYTITKDGASEIEGGMQTELQNEFESPSNEIAIKACIDNEGKWHHEVKLSENVWKNANAKMKEARQQVEEEIKKQAEDEVKRKKRFDGVPDESAPEFKHAVPGEGEFYKENMGYLKSVAAIWDVGKHIIKDGAMPQFIWDNGERTGEPVDPKIVNDYKNSYFHMPTPLAGGTDQLIEEVTGAIQLVKTGYEFIRHPKQTLQQVWTGIKELDGEKLKKIAKAMSGYDNYEKGGARATYQGGKHAVQIVMVVLAPMKNLGKGADIIKEGGDQFKKLDDFVVGSKSDEIGGIVNNARANKMEIKQVGDDKLLTQNVDNGTTSTMVLDKNSNGEVDYVKIGDDDLADPKNPSVKATHADIESDLHEVDLVPEEVGDLLKVNGGSKGNWTKALNKPPPGKKIKVDDNFTYSTIEIQRADGSKIVVSKRAEADELKIDVKRDRNTFQQTKAKNEGGQVGTDDGGHLFASRFNGPGEKINIVAMDRVKNRSGQGGDWYNMEEGWARYLQTTGNKIKKVVVDITYDAKGRPTRFDISWDQIDANGTLTKKSQRISN